MVNKLLNSKIIEYLPSFIVKKLIRKFKIYFTKTSLNILPNNNYPFIIKYSELDYFVTKFSKSQLFSFETPLTSFPSLFQLLKVLFDEKKFPKFNFLDFGAQYIDNYLFLNQKLKHINYFYFDQEINNKIVKKFSDNKGFKNFNVINNLQEIDNNKYDFVNFGSAIQYIDNYKEILDRITVSKPKFILFSGINFFFDIKKNTIIMKQHNVWPQINFCFFFNYEYFDNLLNTLGYELYFSSKNFSTNKINYKNIIKDFNNNIQYLDLLFKLK